jgi:Neurotransmitter-gated ion-channel ligand binding domain/Neurotransmitter-gated ion-channel transmembrane region
MAAGKLSAVTSGSSLIKVLTLALLSFAAVVGERRSALAQAAPAALPKPPTEHGGKIKVSVALYVINLVDIDEVGGRFKIDAYLIANWRDQRLAFTPSGADDQSRNYLPGAAWHPSFEFVNGVEPHTRFDSQMQVKPDGSVTYVYRLAATLSNKYLLRPFPFDSQTLQMDVQPFMADADDLKLEAAAEGGISDESYAGLPQWIVRGLTAQVRQVSQDSGRRDIPEIRFSIGVTRRYQFFIWKIFLPLTLMVTVSWAVFWLRPADLDNQIMIAVTTILTVIAFGFSISVTLPKVPYLTYIDAFFLTCYVFVFLSIVELMTVHVIQRRGLTELASRTRLASRWIFPGAFLLANLVTILHFFG